MQMTLDIPETIYRSFEQRAELEGKAAEELMIEALGAEVVTEAAPGPHITYDGPWGFPRIHSREPGMMEFGPEGVYEYISFP